MSKCVLKMRRNLFPILIALPKKVVNYFRSMLKTTSTQKAPVVPIPANARIAENESLMDSRFRGSDGLGDFLRDRQYSIFNF